MDRDHTNSIEMVKLLIKNGANWAAQDENGRDILGYVLWDDEPLCSENFKNLVKYLVKDVGLPVPVTMPNQWTNGSRMGEKEIKAVFEEARREPRSLAILARRAVWRVHRVEQLNNEDVPENLRLFLNE